MRKQFAQTLLSVGEDKRLAVLIGDISHFLLREFEAKYQDRFYNLGIAEQSMVSVAAGLALNGFFPIVHSIAPFITERCYEQIKDDLCYQKLGVNIVSVGSAFDYASLGCTHHCYGDVAILRALPNMQIISPAAPQEFDILFRETYSNGFPTYFRLPNNTHHIKTYPKFGEIEKLKEGKDATVIVTGPQLQNAFDAISDLEQEKITCDLIYLTTIKPLSESAKEAIIKSAGKTRRILTVEEHTIIGGIADEISMICRNVPVIYERMGILDKFLTSYGTYREHCCANNLTKEGITNAIRKLKPRNNF